VSHRNRTRAENRHPTTGAAPSSIYRARTGAFWRICQKICQKTVRSRTLERNSGPEGPLFARVIDGGGGGVLVQDIGKG
jgi:hypothetical protein